MQKHGLTAGDLIRIYLASGSSNGNTDRPAVAFGTAWPSFLDAEDEIQLTDVALLNCQAKLGDRLAVERVVGPQAVAHSVAVSFTAPFASTEFTAIHAKEVLVDIGYVRPGMLVDIGISGTKRRMRVGSIELQNRAMDLDIDEGVVISREHTKVVVVEAPSEALVAESNGGQIAGYDSIGGLDKEISEVRRLIEASLREPHLFAEYGLQPPRGVLLFGPPGTGKTLIARAVAAESQAHVHIINGAEIVNKFYGETEAKLRDIFDSARRQSPSVIFIDEVDALCPKRDDSDGEAEKRIVATLLTLMDGIADRSNDRVVVIGATNRPNAIDPALRRPGRFDREVEVPIPSPSARLQILRKKLAGTPNSLTLEQVELVAAATHGFVGADLEALVRESAVIAIKRHSSQVAVVNGVLSSQAAVVNDVLSSQVETSNDMLPSQAEASNDLTHLKVEHSDVLSGLRLVRPSTMREVTLEIPNVKWSDIGGQHETKQLLKESVEWPLKHPEAFQRMGIRPPKGVLLYGPPGCSKTLTAKALATEAGLNFIAVRGPELFSKWVGESEKAVREVFRKARAAAPAIVFFDEIDALTVKRGAAGDGTSVADRVLSQLLTELDGIEPLVNVTVVAATNRPDVIDAGILRPDRIDRLIYVGPPDTPTRADIFRIQLRRIACANSVDAEALAKQTDGFSGAEVVSLCQEAAIEAMTEDPDALCVEPRHFERCLAGFKRRITPEMLQFYADFRAKTKHNEIKTLCKALSNALEVDNKTELKELLNKLYAIRVDEKLLRATGAGQVVGKLRNYEEPNIAVLAKKVVHKWKKDVMAANSRPNGPLVGAASSSGSQTPSSVSQAPTPQRPQSGERTSESSQMPLESSDGRPVARAPLNGAAGNDASVPSSLATTRPASSLGTDGTRTSNAASPTESLALQTQAPRTAATDEASIPQTGDAVRDKCAELLYNSIAIDSNADSELLAKRASAIERIEFEKAASTTTAYRARIRSLCLNLRDKKNPVMRSNLVEGDLTVERFCSMTSEEMASKELKETIEKMKEENLFKAQGAGRTEAATDMFRCGRCKGRKCTYYQMQTRSADEPMTTFVTCTVCNNRWKFC
ncbi:AAA+-type ATPase [Coemansia sp. S680]|nr:AAA+-type ATPase [Coemansia sp. S680]